MKIKIVVILVLKDHKATVAVNKTHVEIHY